jgi:hypothetical protein
VREPRASRGDVDTRVRDLLNAIRASCDRREGESYDAANERHVEELTVPLVMALQVGAVLILISRGIPTWTDNAYRHENRADNLGSLRRVPRRPSAT